MRTSGQVKSWDAWDQLNHPNFQIQDTKKFEEVEQELDDQIEEGLQIVGTLSCSESWALMHELRCQVNSYDWAQQQFGCQSNGVHHIGRVHCKGKPCFFAHCFMISISSLVFRAPDTSIL